MTDFLLLLLFGACWTWGFRTPFQEGYILEWLGNLFKTINPNTGKNESTWLTKPFFDCPPCMASIHGFFISAVYYDWRIIHMAAYMVCLCGLNFIIKSWLYPEYEDVLKNSENDKLRKLVYDAWVDRDQSNLNFTEWWEKNKSKFDKI